MKRDDVKAKIPDITEEQLDWLMGENGADINREKTAAAAIRTELDKATAQLKTAQDGLAKFDGVDVNDLKAQVKKLNEDMKAQADGYAFNSALDTAILGKKGRSVKAVRALLDIDSLKKSTDLSVDIGKALEAAQKENPWAFGEAGTGVSVSTGGEHGTPPSGTTDAVTAAFQNLNPGIKIE